MFEESYSLAIIFIDINKLMKGSVNAKGDICVKYCGVMKKVPPIFPGQSWKVAQAMAIFALSPHCALAISCKIRKHFEYTNVF